MSLDPALGAEIRGDAGGKQAERDGEGANDPGKLDAAAQHEVVQNAEDEDQNGSFSEKRRAAARGDDGEFREL